MTRRHFLTATVAAAAAARAQSKRPLNVLFVVSDDLSPTTLGCYGHRLVQSPNVDRLARAGTRFDRAYCQYALCAPSRASFLTGLRPDATRVLTNGPDFREFIPNTVTMPQLFKNNGYVSIREGKMFHMGVPGTVGTPRWQDPPSWNHDGSPRGKEHESKGERKNLTPHIPGAGVSMQYVKTPDASEQADFDAANRAIAHLEKHRNEPFFLGLGFVRPHVPFVAPGKYFDLYPLEKVKPFSNPPGDLDDIPAIVPLTLANTSHHMKMNEDQQREALRGYYASVSFMDDQLGRVLQALDRLKLRDHTVVVFQSDHGWHLGEHTFWQKRSLMEESAKVPLVISAPGMKRGQATRALTELVDVYPTLAELCGIPLAHPLDGKSLAPVLRNGSAPHKTEAHTQLNAGQTEGRAVRTERYRYIRWRSQQSVAEELYDHQRDPHEFTNLASDRQMTDILERHRALVPRAPSTIGE